MAQQRESVNEGLPALRYSTVNLWPGLLLLLLSAELAVSGAVGVQVKLTELSPVSQPDIAGGLGSV